MDFSVKKTGDTNYSSEEENKNLKQTIFHLKKELNRLREPPLLVCKIVKIIGNKAIVQLPNGNRFFVNIANDLITKLTINDRVLAEQKSLVLVEKLDSSKQFDVENFVILEKPKISWNCIGGLSEQVREIKEVIELPLKKPDLFKNIGIEPPKGILLHGPSGTGKTMLAKAAAASTKSTFIEIVGSELVQKFIGEGAKLVKDIFNLAKEKAPSIVFIDELDAIAAERIDLGTSGEREVQRTFMQLLSEIDGFKPLENVKIIGTTNRMDILDNAVIRPGRLDRLIEVPLPDTKGREEILKIHTKSMSLEKVDLKNLASVIEEFSGAEIKALCTEAGYFAIRDSRKKVTTEDFIKAIQKITQQESLEHLNMFG